MPRVSVTVPHAFDPDEVMDKAQPTIQKMIEDFEGKDFHMTVSGRSGDFSFKSMMFPIKGNIAVDEQNIAVSIDLPFAAMMFKDKVEKAIRKNLVKALGGDEEDTSDTEE